MFSFSSEPLSTNIIDETKYENGFELKLNTSMFFNALKINISSAEWSDHIINRSVNETGIIDIYNLSAGTYYNLNILTIIETDVYKIYSDRTTNETVFTSKIIDFRMTFHQNFCKQNEYMYLKYFMMCASCKLDAGRYYFKINLFLKCCYLKKLISSKEYFNVSVLGERSIQKIL